MTLVPVLSQSFKSLKSLFFYIYMAGSRSVEYTTSSKCDRFKKLRSERAM